MFNGNVFFDDYKILRTSLYETIYKFAHIKFGFIFWALFRDNGYWYNLSSFIEKKPIRV